MALFDTYVSAEVVWLFLGLVLLMCELFVPGLILIFFGIGAWVVAGVVFLFDISVNVQIVVFLFSSVLSLVILRKYLKGYFYGLKKDSLGTEKDMDDIVGQKATVLCDFGPGEQGKILFRGTPWNAESREKLAKDALVVIVAREGLVMKVETQRITNDQGTITK